jgi:methionine sulfoxide reductase heme-binding subunit
VRGDPTLWILARSTGIVAYALLSATVLAGLTARARPVRALPPAATVEVHRFLSLLALMAVGLHGVFLALDASVPIPALALVVPGASPYRPLWVGLGVAGAELMLLVHLSFRLRRRIGVRNWRRLHYATYVAFLGATAHGLMAGTDSARPWALAMYAGASGAVVALTSWRILSPRPVPRPAGREARTGG